MIPNSSLNEIRQLFESQGDEQYYGEDVSQLEHAAQGAELARKGGFDKEVQAAAFLHDIGHLMPAEQEEELMEMYGRKDHEEIAADWLREKGFPEKVCILVANHVNAKRYLTFKNPKYFAGLSEASLKTLEFQGGPMQAEEAAVFEQNPYFELIIQMRRWDEAAKVTGLPKPDLEKYLALCEEVLV
ncbi:phosphonate degradation HD-domain oxygenase [Runella sp.]|uniref:phosphonate degradation HD-domain oxygenase n=1 Tax=Runella sp. TaxID=1960881 RepID=UPI003D10350F